jgi:hypothetical protein
MLFVGMQSPALLTYHQQQRQRQPYPKHTQLLNHCGVYRYNAGGVRLASLYVPKQTAALKGPEIKPLYHLKLQFIRTPNCYPVLFTVGGTHLMLWTGCAKGYTSWLFRAS